MPDDGTPQEPKYLGDIQPDEVDQAKFNIQPYLADDALRDAVNLAIELGRPLLLRGEPGCGKSRLAQAVAYEFGRRYQVEHGENEFPWPFEFWPVKSTSRARDGLYIFDAVSRLRDAQLAATHRAAEDKSVAEAAHKRFEDPKHYIRLGQLGLAFQNKIRTVVLIDEIDKADIDFPNDLLIELDERRFFIEELTTDGTKKQNQEADDDEAAEAEGQHVRRIKHDNGWVTAESRPIVFITSNAEKELPDAFLRRCVFYFIDFPKPNQLHQIVSAHFYPEVSWPDNLEEDSCPNGLSTESCELIKEAVKRFVGLREDLKGAPKLTSTSELLDWYRVLISWHKDPADALAFLKEDERLPYISVLVKSRDEQRRFGRQKGQANG